VEERAVRPPVLILPLANQQSYTARYSAPDKIRYGLDKPERGQRPTGTSTPAWRRFSFSCRPSMPDWVRTSSASRTENPNYAGSSRSQIHSDPSGPLDSGIRHRSTHGWRGRRPLAWPDAPLRTSSTATAGEFKAPEPVMRHPEKDGDSYNNSYNNSYINSYYNPFCRHSPHPVIQLTWSRSSTSRVLPSAGARPLCQLLGSRREQAATWHNVRTK
jgi:hypothetical protein